MPPPSRRLNRRVGAAGNPTGRLTVLYIAALSAVALLSLVGQAVVQWQIQRQMNDSRVVNIAGRQRMFSQRLVKLALLLAEPDVKNREGRVEDARKTLALWRRCHDGLQNGDEELALPGRNSAEVTSMFTKVDGDFREIASGMTELLERMSTDDRPAGVPATLIAPLQRVLDHETDFLDGMDAIVFQYASEAQARVSQLRMIEWLLVGLTLSVLLFEGMFVFRPAVHSLADAMAQLDRTQRELIRSRDAARAASEAKTRFLANISHELRTPLNAVIGMTELARTTDFPAKRSMYLETVADASQSLLVLLNDLIDVSRVEANELRLQEGSVDLPRLVHGAAALLRHGAEAKGLELCVEIADDAPTVTYGDEVRLRQVLVNLLSNAVKFTDAGHVALSYRLVDGPKGEDLLRFSIVDTGVGVRPGDQQRIFELFYQADGNPGQAGGGVGLGLPISAKLAGLMGGGITVESEMGVGSTFHFDVPWQKPVVETATRPAADVTTTTADRPSLRVLVVEDSPVNQLLVRETLEGAGHVATVAGTFAEAQVLLADKWDAAIVDISLPDATGWQVVEAIRKSDMRAPDQCTAIIVITAHAGPDGASRDPSPGHDALLVKPFAPHDLLEALHAAAASEEWRPAAQAAEIAATSRNGLAHTTDAIPEVNWCEAVERLGGNEALALRLLEVLSQQLAVQRLELADLAACGDGRQLRLIAHRLAGQASNFDALRTLDALARLEAAAAGNGDSLSEAVANADEALARLATWVDDKLETTGLART
jgi:signal transduction histidine kinase/DNA-binding response OmpR family regulator